MGVHINYIGAVVNTSWQELDIPCHLVIKNMAELVHMLGSNQFISAEEKPATRVLSQTLD